MKRAYKMRAYPTKQQACRSNALLAVHCELYNAALQERRDAWSMAKESISFYTQSAQLSDVRLARPDVALGSASAQQRTLLRLDRSFQAFFRRVKAGETAGYPRFKSRHRFDTVDHTNGNGSKWTPTEGRWAKAYFKGVGTLKVSEHTRVEGQVTQVSLKRENNGRRWYVVVIAEQPPISLEPTGNSVGVDVGIARFLTTSDGQVVGNPRFSKIASGEMADLQQRLAKCKRGSGNSKRLRRRIAKLHRKTKNRRLDFHHKTSRELVNDNDFIAVENLNIQAMSKRAKPRPDSENPGEWLPNGGAAKTGLNRSIADVGWAQFISLLLSKAECAERVVVKVDPAYTSINCHQCNTRCTRPRQDTVICPTCGPMDADINGARNILRAGLGSHESV